jgi:RNA recognition motif-containing protein
MLRRAAGKTWTDDSLADWPTNDFRIFVGNLGPEVNDDMLHQHFSKYASLQRVRVIGSSSSSSSSNSISQVGADSHQQQQHGGQPHYNTQQQSQQQQQQGGNKKQKPKGYGFVSLGDALECAKALREMDQTWLGSRPIRLKRSTWKDRQAPPAATGSSAKKQHQHHHQNNNKKKPPRR